MARCWTCGTKVDMYSYTCPSCKNLTELKNLRKSVEIHATDMSELALAQIDNFKALYSTLSSGLSEIASCIEWGFGELSWQLQQQKEVLRSIDNTLKTPSETQANEWRIMAEELRRRGVLDESKEFYLKALELNRLDYRLYVGLAETYLQINEFDNAKIFLEKSLPHAPKKEIDYKSYSYRLIGHIYACEEDYNQAVTILNSSIELSPTYTDGHYDYAQYCAQIGNTEFCLPSLQKAIFCQPLYWYLAQKERNFDPIRKDVLNLLNKIRQKVYAQAHSLISEGNSALRSAESLWKKFYTIKANRPIIFKIKEIENDIESSDYETILKAKPKAKKILNTAKLAKSAISDAENYPVHLLEWKAKMLNRINSYITLHCISICCFTIFFITIFTGGLGFSWLFIIAGWVIEILAENKEIDDSLIDYDELWGGWVAPIMCIVMLFKCSEAKAKIEARYERDLANGIERIIKNVNGFIQ